MCNINVLAPAPEQFVEKLPHDFKLADLARYFHLPINEAAQQLNICTTLLKKLCRNNGVKRWPHRKLKSLDVLITTLESQLENDQSNTSIQDQLGALKQKRAVILASPDVEYKMLVPKSKRKLASKSQSKAIPKAIVKKDSKKLKSVSSAVLDADIENEYIANSGVAPLLVKSVPALTSTPTTRTTQQEETLTVVSSEVKPMPQLGLTLAHLDQSTPVPMEVIEEFEIIPLKSTMFVNLRRSDSKIFEELKAQFPLEKFPRLVLNAA